MVAPRGGVAERLANGVVVEPETGHSWGRGSYRLKRAATIRGSSYVWTGRPLRSKVAFAERDDVNLLERRTVGNLPVRSPQ